MSLIFLDRLQLSDVLGPPCHHHGHPGAPRHLQREEEPGPALATLVTQSSLTNLITTDISDRQVSAGDSDLQCCGGCVHCIHSNILHPASPLENNSDSHHLDISQKNLQQLVWNILYQINRSYNILTLIKYIGSK